jgi:hypothetical protein
MKVPAGTFTIEGHWSQSLKAVSGFGVWANIDELQTPTTNVQSNAIASRMATSSA